MSLKKRDVKLSTSSKKSLVLGPSSSLGLLESRSYAKTEPDSCWISQTRFLIFLIKVIFILFIGVLGIWLLPSRIDPVLFSFGKDLLEFKGSMEVNDVLKNARKVLEGEIIGPEYLVRDKIGNIFTGLADGRIIMLSSDFVTFETIIYTGEQNDSLTCGNEINERKCGRPLGMEFDPSNNNILFVADTSIGLLRVDIISKNIDVLLPMETIVDGKKLTFINDLIVLPNRTILISESSSKHSRINNRYEILEGRDNGRLLYYDLLDRSYGVLIPDLHFANGICLSNDQKSVLIAETTRAKIMRYYLVGEKSGEIEVFMDSLPGLPDNISPSTNGGYWIGIALVRTPLLEYMSNSNIGVFLRFVMSKWMYLLYLLESVLPKHGLIIEINPSGTILRSFHDLGGNTVGATSHILDMQDYILVGSYFEPFLLLISL